MQQIEMHKSASSVDRVLKLPDQPGDATRTFSSEGSLELTPKSSLFQGKPSISSNTRFVFSNQRLSTSRSKSKDSVRKLVKVREGCQLRKRSKLALAMSRFDRMDQTSKVLLSKSNTHDDDVRSINDMAQQEQSLLLTELHLQEMANETRQKHLLDKTVLFKLTVKQFDNIIRDAHRKYTRAMYQISKCRADSAHLETEKMHLMNEIKNLNKVLEKRQRTQEIRPVHEFMQNVKASGEFYKTPDDMMNRFYAMKNNLGVLMTKYEEDLDTQEKLISEEKEMVQSGMQTCMNLRTHIVDMKQYLSELKTRNISLTIDSCKLEDSKKEEDLAIFTIKAAIQNISQNIANFRPMTGRKFAKIGKNWRLQLQEIATTIVFYNEIIRDHRHAPTHVPRSAKPHSPNAQKDAYASWTTSKESFKTSLSSSRRGSL